jgi:RNA 3'-terminal phosphate cyclase (ATP)
VVEIDGSRFSGSGSIVRQATAYAALTRTPIRMINVRAKRGDEGLRRQHLAAVRAISDLVGGDLEGAAVGARSFVFRPGDREPTGEFHWDVGSAGSTTAVALAVLGVLAGSGTAAQVQVTGGVFQDFCPSLLHLQHVLTPLLARMGLGVEFELVRAGYVPRGGGVIRVSSSGTAGLRPLVPERGTLRVVRGVSLASHLEERRVARRMAEAALEVLFERDIDPSIDERNDVGATQRGAAFALIADYEGGCRLGADGAGAPGRRSEDIGRRVALQLLEEMDGPATVDRFAADQLIAFAALADGTSTFVAPRISGHVESAAWLASAFLGVDVHTDDTGLISVSGRGSPTGRS